MKVAVFPGSFNPFTKGHAVIVEKALSVFDKVIIAVGCNSQKQVTSVENRLEIIQKLYAENSQVEVAQYDCLTVDFCKKIGATHIVRGLRNASDFQYEQPIAQTNVELAGIETVFFVTPPELSHISSSIVRELQYYGANVSQYLPEESSELRN